MASITRELRIKTTTRPVTSRPAAEYEPGAIMATDDQVFGNGCHQGPVFAARADVAGPMGNGGHPSERHRGGRRRPRAPGSGVNRPIVGAGVVLEEIKIYRRRQVGEDGVDHLADLKDTKNVAFNVAAPFLQRVGGPSAKVNWQRDDEAVPVTIAAAKQKCHATRQCGSDRGRHQTSLPHAAIVQIKPV